MESSVMRIAVAFFLLSMPCFAQKTLCGGLLSVTDTVPPTYLPLAKAAHVEGNVILMVTFDTSGEASHVSLVSGPTMLVSSAIDYVKSWRANQYSGPRTCPIVIRYEIVKEDDHDPRMLIKPDPQHVVIRAEVPCLCDPPADLVPRKKRFWLF
jgi:hypothetical protein